MNKEYGVFNAYSPYEKTFNEKLYTAVIRFRDVSSFEPLKDYNVSGTLLSLTNGVNYIVLHPIEEVFNMVFPDGDPEDLIIIPSSTPPDYEEPEEDNDNNFEIE